jgi:hypothetical protein
MQHHGKTVKFEFIFKPVQGLTWPAVNILVNNFQISTNTVSPESPTVTVDVHADSGSNNISIVYFNKHERETVLEHGNIVADQSLELLSIRADDILLEPWVWTEHYYLPSYFQGFKRQFPDAPDRLRSQLVWHFPGRYMITGLPDTKQFWNWYQAQRTARVLEELIDPTGQIRSNYDPLDNEDKELIKDIKNLINV